MAKFRLGINMAGAVSAGAYTAGVLDFLMEALEEWETAKAGVRAYLANPGAAVPSLAPLHEVQIDVFSGASAGGMCAAIAAVMVQQDFAHILTGDEQGTTNTFYESWVNQISIDRLLETKDMAGGGPLLSLLDCTVLDEIAAYALAPTGTKARPYIADDLTLFLTLSNVQGTPYRLYSDATSTEEFVSYYSDRIRFEVTRDGTTQTPTAKPLPAGQPGQGAWLLLQEAAKATGAVPVALASRVLPRDRGDYDVPGWEPLNPAGAVLVPAYPEGTPEVIETLYVDGGVTDNSPSLLADGYLAGRLGQNPNPPEPDRANAAVITIAPFPSEDAFDAGYKPADHQGIWSILMSFLNITLSQSRFLGEGLQVLTEGASFSRFVVAPSDTDAVAAGKPVLQCGALGAFGGFFSRDFRKHDFLLGRRNCQQFLRARLAVLTANPIIADGLTEAGVLAEGIKDHFQVTCPSDNPTLEQGKIWMPLIPLCGSATAEVAVPPRGALGPDDLDAIVDQIVVRLNAIRGKLVPGSLGNVVSDGLGFLLNTWIVSGKVKDAIKEALAEALDGDTAAQA